MAKVAYEPRVEAREKGKEVYSASWLDRLVDLIKRLPGPSWLYYVGLGLALIVVETGLRWYEGADAPGTFNEFFILNALVISYMLGLFEHLDNVASLALAKFRPVMDVTQKEYELIEYKLTTMPFWPVLVVSLIAASFPTTQVLTGNAGYLRDIGMFKAPFSGIFDVVEGMIFWGVFGALAFHTVRQLMMVNQLTSHSRVSLFEPGPMYAFSSLTARTAVGLVGLAYFGAVALPQNWLFRPDFVAPILGAVGMSVVTFVWPLLGVHRLLAEEKEKRQAVLAERLNGIINVLEKEEKPLEVKDGEMAKVKEALDAITAAHTEVNKISTWPWRGETVAGLVTSVFLPLLLWLVIRVLETLISF